MIDRALRRVVQERLSRYPAVALIGPRQCGKTTLARAIGGDYYDLEQENDRLRVDIEWPTVEKSARLTVLDEAQAAAEVFVRLRGAIDADRDRSGRFLILGSVSPTLMRGFSESLAGRLSVVDLTPLVYAELPDVPLRELWRVGGYPDGGILEESRYPRWQRDYLQLLVQRDLPSWGLPARPNVTDRLLRMTAAVHGQLFNATQLGQSLGVSYHTWLGLTGLAECPKFILYYY
jgi:predicted AAA+ superfamily ATPase